MQLAGLSAALAVTGCSTATHPELKPLGRRQTQWDMSWRERIKTPYRMAFDTADVLGGMSLAWVTAYRSGADEVYGPGQTSTVLCLRHSSLPIALGDDMWNRLRLGEGLKLKDPTSGEITTRNPFINYKAGDKYTMVGKDGALDSLIASGTIVLACNSAFSGYVGMLAQREKLATDEARRQALASLVTGVILMPTGVFAVGAAQDAGCACLVVR